MDVTILPNIRRITFTSAIEINIETAKTLKYQQIPAWDSVGHMGLMAAIEDAFDIMMEPDDIIDFSSYVKGKEILSTRYSIDFSA